MATDYDAPRRRSDDDLETDSLEGLQAAEASNNGMDDDGEIVEAFEPPSIDLTGEELNVTVVPKREDEFRCDSCYLVQKRARLARTESDGSMICKDCD